MNDKLMEWLRGVIDCIQDLQKDFEQNKGLILTEGDLECLLFCKLNHCPLFAQREETKSDGRRSGYVHSQVTWFKPPFDGGFRVDLTVLDPANLHVEKIEMVADWPNKGFFHDGMAIAIEAKFIRDQNIKKISNDAQQDYIKIVKNLKTAKEQLISDGKYTNVKESDLAYIALIGCKTREIFDTAIEKLNGALAREACPQNVFPIIFCPDKIEFLNKGSVQPDQAAAHRR